MTDKSAKDGCRTYRPQLKSRSVVYGKGSLSQEKAPRTATSSNWMGNHQHRVKTCKSEGFEHLITPLTFQLLLRQVPNHQIIFGNLGLVFVSQRELERWEHDIIQICDCFVFHGNQKGIEVRNYLIFQAWMKPIVKPVTYSRLGVWMFEEGGRP